MASYESLKWRESEPGVWSRDTDEIEYFYAAIAKLYEGSGRVFFAITGHISLHVDPDQFDQAVTEESVDTALRMGWLALRRAHPTIASYTELNPTTGTFSKIYRSSEDGWLDNTFVPISNGQNGVEWANSDPPVPKLPTLFVLTPPASSDKIIRRDLVLRSPHDIMDGIGTLMLFNNLVTHAAEALRLGNAFSPAPVDKALTEQRLSPSYRIAAAVPEIHTEAMKKRLARLAAAAEPDATKESVDAVKLAFIHGELTPGKHQRVEITLSPERTARLLASAKKLGATVTHVYHAAIALALRDLQSKNEHDRPVQYINYILRNERPYCQPPYNGHQHPAALYHSVSGEKLVIDMVVPNQNAVPGESTDQEEFVKIVKHMRDFYHAVRDDPEHSAVVPDLWAKGNPKVPVQEDPSQVLPIPPPDLTPVAGISSMGKIDSVLAEKVGAFEVYNPWVTGEELRSGLGLFLGTFRGRLSLSAAYNDAWHNEQGTMDFLKRCHGIVERGLDI
jgi:hypothetical protein